MIFLYNLFIRFYSFGIWISSFFNPKTKKLKDGRATIFSANFPAKKNKRVWMHCASLGEFEQGRPIIELIKQQDASIEIILTFFSPSGFEIRKNYPVADFISYLPADTKSNANNFIKKIQPDIAVFVKYEFWFHFLNTLKEQKISTLLVSAIFRKEQFSKAIYSSFFKKMIGCFDAIYLQNKSSESILIENGFTNGIVNGDTRVDRVLQISNHKKQFDIVEKFADNHKVFVVGSSWPKDEEILIPFIKDAANVDWKFIIAPHNIDEKFVSGIENKLSGNAIKYTAATMDNISNKNVLIINNIGMLSSLYQYGDIAYIGGGFGTGIHNILEPAAFHLPIIIGPNYSKFEEANVLVDQKGVFAIQSQEDLQSIFKQLSNPSYYLTTSQATKNYIESNQGASKIIVEDILKKLKR